ncbi:MAG: hypothetical protein H8E44_31785 [Planctomycetes bacterium]|nr:hypothetical protein [Planctomycetota bacterium]MBL7042754.1 hypothetical protein [Pirellulaceae bacterium]
MRSWHVQRRKRFVIVWLTLAFLLGLATCSFAAPPTAGPRPDLLVPHGPTPGLVSLFVLSGLAAILITAIMIVDVVSVWRRHQSYNDRTPIS